MSQLFKIIKLTEGKNGEDYCDANGVVTLFTDGDSAAGYASRLSLQHGERYQPRPFKSAVDWRARERARFDIGTYKPLPFANERWFLDSPHSDLHFAHIAAYPAMVAYTKDEISGVRDIQTPIRAGRYLERFFDLDVWDVKKWANIMQAIPASEELRFARTEDEIISIYRTSSCAPDSCMRYSFNQLPKHPSAVYVGDLSVAYLMGFEYSDSEERVPIARALVWESKKQYLRIYGHHSEAENKMESVLLSLGYEGVQIFEGARGQRVECNYGILMPYLDNNMAYIDTGDEILWTRQGSGCDSTDGYVDDDSRRCDRCGNRMDDDESYNIGDESWCDSCYSSHTFHCESCEESYSDNNTSHEVFYMSRNGSTRSDTMCEFCAGNKAFICEETNEYWRLDDGVTMANGNTVSPSWYEENGFQCEECNESFENGVDGESPYCDDCRKGLATHSEDGERRIRLLLRTTALVRYRPSPTIHCESQFEFEFTFGWTPAGREESEARQARQWAESMLGDARDALGAFNPLAIVLPFPKHSPTR